MVIAKDAHERKMSIPAEVGREGFIVEEGFKCTLEICLLWQMKVEKGTSQAGERVGGREVPELRVCKAYLDPGVGDGQGSLACCSPWGHNESDTTE